MILIGVAICQKIVLDVFVKRGLKYFLIDAAKTPMTLTLSSQVYLCNVVFISLV